jgi:leucyl/phenylalanyl-tRNA--protein transferase
MLQEVVAGYANGYYLMANDDGTDLHWYGADKHTLMPLDHRLHIPKSLRRVLNQDRFSVRISTDVQAVIKGCQNRATTWISAELADIYLQLAAFGVVQTYETWQGDTLAGGVLGLWLGGAFIGESMFTAIEDGGKVALVRLCQHLANKGFVLFDAQLTNPHLERFGSYEVDLPTYETMLQEAIHIDTNFQ